MTNRIVCIVGLSGTGKTEVVNHFVSKGGYERVSFSDTMLNATKEKYGELNQTNERRMRNELRAEHGMAALAVLTIDTLKEAYTKGNVVLESLYSWEEYLMLKEVFGDVISLVATISQKEVRYARMAKREIRPLSKEEVIKRDLSEISEINKGGPIAYADYFLVNNGELEELQKEAEKLF